MRRLEHLLARSARRVPDRVAIEHGAGTITYRELDERAAAWSERLAALGIRAGHRVALSAPPSIDAVTAIFAVLKSGAAYVPLDPQAPLHRRQRLARDSAVQAVIVEPPGPGGEPAVRGGEPGSRLGTRLRVLPGADGPASTSSDSPEALAYVLYTSGSTGEPKGVMWSHGGARSFVDWAAELIRPTAADRFSAHAPFHFDLSVFDLFVSLGHGATLVLLDEVARRTPSALARFISERRLTVWYSTPSVLSLLARYGKLERHDLSALRAVLFAGEVFPVDDLIELRRALPDAALYNLYGPTETNVCTFHRVAGRIPREARRRGLPIGRPCPHFEVRIVGDDGRPAGAGSRGEVQVHGPIMLGYWNRPRQTARSLVTDEGGRRWYRTGDLVEVDAAGSWRFAGRLDRMVKRHGHRVELGEIEEALRHHAGVVEAAAVATEREPGRVAIKAFVRFRGPDGPSQIELRRFVAERLPPQMMPDRFEAVAALPRTSTGKVDYRRLAEGA